MKYLKTFETFDMDNLLDKINKSGINSLTPLEKDFMKAHAEEDVEKLKDIEIKSKAKYFTSSNNILHFYFTGKEMKIDDYRTLYYGTMTVPNIGDEGPLDDTIDGILEGSIEYNDGVIILHFSKYHNGHEYNIEDFCEGLINELYGFAQDIIDELNPSDID